MTAVRPDLPLTPPTAAPAPAGVKAAQAAFFRAALDRAQAPVTAPAATPNAAATAQAEPRREQRPGALLDIRV
ncbi:hypothetical protein [Brevundimonas sp.]|uniref:hypothetical protein n=1 Tax=Brevundimonas sp. TaxID=1871086 RepID=UPI002FD8E650